MRSFRPLSHRHVVCYKVLLTAICLVLLPWAIVGAEPPASEKVAQSPPTGKTSTESKKLKSGAGEFVSFKNGTLTLKGRTSNFTFDNIGDNYKTLDRQMPRPAY